MPIIGDKIGMRTERKRPLIEELDETSEVEIPLKGIVRTFFLKQSIIKRTYLYTRGVRSENEFFNVVYADRF